MGIFLGLMLIIGALLLIHYGMGFVLIGVMVLMIGITVVKKS